MHGAPRAKPREKVPPAAFKVDYSVQLHVCQQSVNFLSSFTARQYGEEEEEGSLRPGRNPKYSKVRAERKSSVQCAVRFLHALVRKTVHFQENMSTTFSPHQRLPDRTRRHGAATALSVPQISNTTSQMRRQCDQRRHALSG